jgi:sulfur-oxidizing protein SoxY
MMRAMRLVLGLALAWMASPAFAAEAAWPALQAMLFGERELKDGSEVIRLVAPARAHDAAVVPMTIEAVAPQTPERWIRRVWLVIDDNPAPVAGVFHFQPDHGRASIATRVRVNSYTPVHAVAETSDDELWVVDAYVKAAGGCSAPALKDPQEAMARLGKMRLRSVSPFVPGEVNKAQLLIAHPNYTGLQIDQLSRNWIPPDYVQSIKVSYAGRTVLEVEGDISLSEDPSMTFAFQPQAPGTLEVVVEDSQGRRFQQSWELGPTS